MILPELSLHCSGRAPNGTAVLFSSLQGLEYDTVVLADDFFFEPLVGGEQNVWGSAENVRQWFMLERKRTSCVAISVVLLGGSFAGLKAFSSVDRFKIIPGWKTAVYCSHHVSII